jgi:hypothetical protein
MSRVEIIVGIVLMVLGTIPTFLAWMFPKFWSASRLRNCGHGALLVVLLGIVCICLALLQRPTIPFVAHSLPQPEAGSGDTQISVTHGKHNAYDISTFVKARLSLGDDITAQRLFLHEWSNRSVCWQAYITYIGLGKNGEITLIGLSPEKKPVACQWVAIHKGDVPTTLHSAFDMLRVGDEISVEGMLDEILQASLTHLRPTKLDRL